MPTIRRVSFLNAFFLMTALSVLVVGGLRLAAIAVHSITYPYSLDYGEGVVLNQVLRLLRHQSLYPDLDKPPFILTTYTPVYHWVVLFLNQWTQNPLAAGRLLSVACTALSGVLIGGVVFLASAGAARRRYRVLGAALAGLFFLSNDYVFSWGMLMRIDMPALFFSFLGIYLFFLWPPEAGKKSYWSVIPFLLAVLTRQTVVEGFLACFLCSLIKFPRFALKYAFLWFLGLALTYGAYALSEKNFIDRVVFANIFQGYDFLGWLYRVIEVTDCLFVLPPIAVLFLGYKSWFEKKSLHSPSVILLFYFLLTFAVSLTGAKDGADVNYLIPLVGAFCILAGVFIAGYFSRFAALGESSADTKFLSLALATLIAIQSLFAIFSSMQSSWFYKDIIIHKAKVKPLEEVLDFIKRAKGPVIAEDQMLILKIGKEIFYEPFIMTELAGVKRWNEKKIIDAIKSKTVDFFIVPYDIEDPVKVRRFGILFSRSFIDSVKENYFLVFKNPGHYVYAPKSGSLTVDA